MPTAPAGAPQRRDTSRRSTDPSGDRSPAPGRRPLTASRRANRAGLAFVSPTFLVVLVVVVLPIAWTALLAFQKARLVDIQGMGLFGNWSLDNFSQVFDSAGFWSSLGTTLLYTAGATLGSVVLGLVAALALRKPFEERFFGVARWIVIAFLAVITLLPFYYMVLLSLKPIDALLLDPGSLWISAKDFTLSTYRDVLRSTDDGGQGFLKFLLNSALVSLGTVVLTLVAAVPGAYAVSRLKFFGHRQVSALFLAVYMFPATLLAVPLFVIFAKIGLSSSLAGLAIVYVAQTVPVSIYMLKNYLVTIPASIEEAAALDGCSRLQTVRKVILPLALPSLMATGLYVFMIAWNEFLFALLFLAADPGQWTVSLGLAQLSNGIEVPKTVLMAGSVVLTIPVVLLFFAAERLLTEGLTSGADKS